MKPDLTDGLVHDLGNNLDLSLQIPTSVSDMDSTATDAAVPASSETSRPVAAASKHPGHIARPAAASQPNKSNSVDTGASTADSAAGQPAGMAERLRMHGNDMFQAGDHARAVELYSAALRELRSRETSGQRVNCAACSQLGGSQALRSALFCQRAR